MKNINYCLVKKNYIYEDLYEILEEEELIMDKIDHKEKIKYEIKKLIDSYIGNKIFFSKKFNSEEESLEDLMVEITREREDDEEIQGNTLLLYSNSDAMYETIFMENISKETNDKELNQLGSISNIELAPIYGNIAIIKSSFLEDKLVNTQITWEDLFELIVNNFYHWGVMINPDGTKLPIEFTGDNPNITIGNNFKQLPAFQLFGLSLVGYSEQLSMNDNLLNEDASKLMGTDIKGRFFITTLCPITSKRFWSLNIDIFNCILKLLDYLGGNDEQKKIIEKLNKELDEDKLKNPFFLIKKYCV
jgi:hypothetical protein